MLIPYPLETPPPLPPLDAAWEAGEADLDSGRRVRRWSKKVEFYDGAILERLEVLGPLEVRDRRIVALEEPLFLWDVEAAGPLRLSARLRLPFERVRYERAEDGTTLWLGGEQESDELLVHCYGGVVEAEEVGSALWLRAQGEDRVRLVVLSAWSVEDRDRTLRALARKGIAGIIDQQLRHNEMITKLGVKVTTPDLDENAQCEFDKLEFESQLQERRSGHRVIEEVSSYGRILLSLGLREPIRDTLRAPLDSSERRWLFAIYASWAGADEFVRRHWRRLIDAIRATEAAIESGDPSVDLRYHEVAALELIPVAEAIGDRGAVELLEQASRAFDGPIEPDPLTPALERWHITPMALEGAVSIAPELPGRWPEMTLERLRIGASTLDVKVRRRPGGLAVKCRLTHGPAVVVHLAPRLARPASGILLDADHFPGPTLTRTLEDEFEGVWLA